MANRKLTELPEITNLNFDSTDLLYIVDSSGDGTSSKITYGNLAGTKIDTISTNFIAYDDLNTLNLNFLSGRIINNINSIDALDGGSVASDTKFELLSTTVRNLSSEVTADILNLEAEIESTLGSTTFNQLTTNVENLSNNQDFFENSLIFGRRGMDSRPSIINQGGTDNNESYFTFDGTMSGQAIFDESKITQLGTVSGNIGTNTTKIGAASLDTTATNLADAVNELHTDIGTNTANINLRITLTTLKAEVAASTDFADFQSRIAALT